MVCEDAALHVLERYYRADIPDEFDSGLSVETLKFLLPLLGSCSIKDFADLIDDFVQVNRVRWVRIVNERKKFTECPYLLQPELLLILYLLEEQPHYLFATLESNIPESYIDQIFNWWGVAADDFRID